MTVNVAGDTTVEADEGFTVTLSAPGNGTITTATASGTIQNDDVLPPPDLAIAALAAVKPEGDSGNTAFTFTVSRTGDLSAASSVSYAVTGSGTAAADANDFGGTLPAGTVNFAAGEASQIVTVNVAGDTTVEADEGFTVTLSAPSNGTITTATASGTIQNDDVLPPPDLAIAALAAVKPEGDSGNTAFTFTVSRTGDLSAASSVSYAVTGSGTAAADANDFGGTLPAGTVNFAAGEASQTVTVNVAGDTTVEADEGFTVTLSAPSNGTITTATASGTIQNDDVPPPPDLAIAPPWRGQAEGDSGNTAFTFTVSRTGDLSAASSVSYAVTGSGTAAADANDFGGTLPAGTVNFAAGEASQTVTINVAGDTTVEADEGFTVTLSAPSNGTITTATASGTIQNDDVPPPPELAIAALAAVKPEGDSGNTAFTFTVSRTGDLSAASSVSYAVTGSGTAAADANDFGGTLPAGTVNFAAGEASQTVTVNVAGDTTVEADEGFTVTLSAPSNGTITTATASGTIQNDDVPPYDINFGNVFLSTSGNDTFVGTSDIDTVSYENAPARVTVSLANTSAQNTRYGIDTLVNIDNLIGSSSNDQLTGNGGDNILDGGVGGDTLTGGAGNDKYILDNSGDLVRENTNAGTDTVYSYITYALTANVENLVLFGTDDLNGTGNGLVNILTGNAGNNMLSGGSGADSLIGAAGDDTYVIDNSGDVVIEKANEGMDVVQASVTYTLSDHVENLTLTGSAAINGIGNELANLLTGNSAANMLEGQEGDDTLNGGSGNDILYGGEGNDTLLGGLGADTLDGGIGADSLNGDGGNDTYIVDDLGDSITDSAGTDLVLSSISYRLGDTLENLTLTGLGSINGTGNMLNNTLTGNDADNTLIGGAGADRLLGGGGNDILEGGAGNDTLTGGFGSDIFRFASPSDRRDTITDFVVGSDKIELNGTNFGIQGVGSLDLLDDLDVAHFVTSRSALTDSDPAFIYNMSTGVLSFDADGQGHDGAVALVKIIGIPELTAADIVIV